MPPGIVDFDHSEAVNALAQGQVAMITEWSAFYSTLVDPKTSKIVNSISRWHQNRRVRTAANLPSEASPSP